LKFKTHKSLFINTLVAAFICLVSGIWMLVNNKVAVGIHSRTFSASGYGGHFLILASLIFFVVAYFTLSPFSKIRRFFEEGKKQKSK
jgi:choline-glycine betaine transporter